MKAVKKAATDRNKRNLLVLYQIFLRASHPGFWGKVTLQFENGILRNQFKLDTIVKVEDKTDEEIRRTLDALMRPDDPSDDE